MLCGSVMGRTPDDRGGAEAGQRTRGGALRLARRLTLGLGWVVFLAGGAAVWFEESGRLNRWIESELARRLGSTTGALSIARTDLSWASRTATLRGLTFGPEGEGLFLEELRVLLGWSPRRGLHLRRVVADGGRLRVSQALVNDLEDLVGSEEELPDSSELEGSFPAFAVRNLHVSVETPDWGDLPVGVLEASLQPGEGGRPELRGRLVPRPEQGTGGVLVLSGRLEDGGALHVDGVARDLVLGIEMLPEGLPAHLAALDPHARFDLAVSGDYILGRDVLPTAKVTVAVRDGDVRLPWFESEQRVEDVQLTLDVSFDPGSPPALWERRVWSAKARLEASWAGAPCTASARLGRDAAEGALADAWIHAPRVAVDDSLVELTDRASAVVDLWESLRPGGEAEGLFGLRLPADWTPEDGLVGGAEYALALRFDGRARTAYVGDPNEEQGGVRNLGFPLPVTGVEGLVTYIRRPHSPYVGELGLFELTGDHGSGRVAVRGSLHWAAERRLLPDGRRVSNPFSLVVETDELAVDDALRRAFDGLVGVQGCDRIWADYAPGGGRLGFRLELWTNPDLRALATDLRIEFDGPGFRWAEIPIPIDDVGLGGRVGSFTFLSEGRGEPGRSLVALDARGTSEVCLGPVLLRGRVEFGPGEEQLARWELSAGKVNLRSSRLREVMDLRNPGAREALDEVGAAGWVDVAVTHSQSGARDPGTSWAEVHDAAGGLILQPKAFPMDTREVRGRLIARVEYPPDRGNGGSTGELRTEVLVGASGRGRWGEEGLGVPVWGEGRFPMDGPGVVRIRGAALDVDNPAVIGALTTAMSRSGGESVELDTRKLDVGGHLDFEAEFTLPEEPGGELTDSRFDLQARLDRLGVGGVNLLKDLQGRLTYHQEQGLWIGESLSALLGRTPVSLSDLRFIRHDDGRVELTTWLSAVGLPIDREHLQFFMDKRTLRTLLEELKGRGWFDVEGGTLTLESTPAGETALSFSGAIAFRDLYVVLGLPVSVASTKKVDIDLRYEGNRVRARAAIAGLYGQVAGRRLDDASMQVTYIEPRLTIEEFDGSFEGGRLRSLGHRASATAGFFSIDLEPPFPFYLSGDLEDVDVGLFLRGVFNSDFANVGRLNGAIRLRGDTEELLAIRGSGEMRIRDTSLWSIPVFQALFSQLGFDTTAIFSSMESRWAVEDGVINMTRMRIKSDLLSLVGDGTVDFDGSLHHDLRIRYSLVDKLGPFTRLLYKIQNSLLRIAIRGDMSRPQVVIKGFISQFFAPPSDAQKLPLPGLGPLVRRF